MTVDVEPRRIGRSHDQLRSVTLEREVAPYAEGSCLVSFGSTRVLCTASVEEGVPGWRRGRGEGWLTAEYAMLPRATRTRTARERSQLVADGGTRTAAITGACVATVDAFNWLVSSERLPQSPVRRRVAGVSVGIVGSTPRLDLDYAEDVIAAVDMNVIMSSEGRFVEVQGTGEHGTFARDDLDDLLSLAVRGLREIDALQRRTLGE